MRFSPGGESPPDPPGKYTIIMIRRQRLKRLKVSLNRFLYIFTLHVKYCVIRQVRPDKALKESGVSKIIYPSFLPWVCVNETDVFVAKVCKAVVTEMDMKSIQPETPCPTPLLKVKYSH